MTTGIDQQLKAAFETESELVQPQPGLADHVRARVRRRRRRRLAAVAAACVLALGGGVAAYAVPGQSHVAGVPQQPAGSRSPRVLATVDYDVTQLAVSGPYLYVVAGQNNLLTAYDRATGKPVAQVRARSEISAFAVGPGGLIWVAYSPDILGAGPSGLWLLSPDLRVYSAAGNIGADTILPTGRMSALIPGQHGLVTVRMPGPGQPVAVTKQQPGTSLGSQETVADFWSGQLGRRVAVQVARGPGLDNRIVIAGQPGLHFGGGAGTQISSVTSTGQALWVTTFAMHDGEASVAGQLVQLNSRLTVVTPGPLRDNPIMARSEGVWSDGDTIWVATGVKGHALVCFTAGSRTGPVTTLPVAGEVMALTETAGTVYVNALQPPGSDAPSPITAYPVPASCR